MDTYFKIGAVIGLLVLLLFALVLLLFAREDYTPSTPVSGEEVWTSIANPPRGTGLFRIVDEQAGVVCYLFEYRGGVDCLSIDDTLLGRHK